MDLGKMVSGAQDALTVRRVFGDAYERDGVTVIPVAKVSGGGGGGMGSSAAETGGGGDEGVGGGFGLRAEPAGVYVIREGRVSWEPAVDVNRIVLGAQLIAVALVLLLRRLAKRRRG